MSCCRAAIQSRLTVAQQRFGFFEILLATLKLGERGSKFAEYDFHFRRQSAMTGLMLNRIVWRIRRVTGIRLLAADELPHQIERQLDVPAELLGVGMELLEQAALFFRPISGGLFESQRRGVGLDLYVGRLEERLSLLFQFLMTNCERIGLLLPLPFDVAAFGFGLGDCLGPFVALLGPFRRLRIERRFAPGEFRFALIQILDQCGALRFHLLFAPQQFGFALDQSNGLRRFRLQLPAIQLGVAVGQLFLTFAEPQPAGANFVFLLGQLRMKLSFAAIELILLRSQMARQLLELQSQLLQLLDREHFGRGVEIRQRHRCRFRPGVGCEFASDRIAVRVNARHPAEAGSRGASPIG